MSTDPYRYFRVEARELLGRLGQGVLDLEKSAPTAQLVQELLRHAHTLKGAARVVKQPAIAEQAHALEDALTPLRAGGIAAKRPAIDDILGHLDLMTQLVTQLVAPLDAESTGAEERPSPDLSPGLSTDPAEVDAIVNGISGALVHMATLRRILAASSGAGAASEQPAAAPGASRQAFKGQADTVAASDPTGAACGGPRSSLGTRARDLPACLDQVERELCQARDAALGLRLVSASSVFGPLERIARDTARALGKSVSFEARGGDLRLEAHVLRGVQDCLVQVVRNAVAHGIEHESGRRASGKPLQGSVRLQVARRGDHAVFVCRDDGQGINLATVRRLAQAKGLLASTPGEATPEALIQLLLRGGLSTSAVVTEFSGRGVGLDVVRAAMARTGGEVAMQTEPSLGTTVEITVPLTLSAFEALLVSAGETVVAIPLEAVRRTVRVTRGELAQGTAGTSVVEDGALVPFASLSRCLQLGPEAEGAREAWTTVILSDGEKLAAIGVERLVGTARVIVRKLPAMAPVDPIVAGVSFDVEGNLQLVLDPRSAVAAAARPFRAPAAPRQLARPPILIVDDSLTTRMLEQSILESAGYDVDLAVSGEDALEKAGRRRYGLFLVDVEMPGMDGFELVQRFRSDPELGQTPAILVTSRDSSEDRLRGELAGARALISKRVFDQVELLGRIKDLIG